MSDETFCSIHQVEMRRYEKSGDSWYSHKLPDGTWCQGREKKPKEDGMTIERLGKGLAKVLEVVEENNRILRAIQIVSAGKREDVDPEEVEI